MTGTMGRIELGASGEAKSIEYLKKAGYRFICRNYRCPLGEIDIIAKNGNDLCFIEVKTRSNKNYGLPQDAVDKNKRNRIMKVALFYLKEKKLSGCNCRFDVISIADGIRLIKNAFPMVRKYNI